MDNFQSDLSRFSYTLELLAPFLRKVDHLWKRKLVALMIAAISSWTICTQFYSCLSKYFGHLFMATVILRNNDYKLIDSVDSWLLRKPFYFRVCELIARSQEVEDETDDSLEQPDNVLIRVDESGNTVHEYSKMLKYTPSSGTYLFWYKGWPLFFHRRDNTPSSHMSISSPGRGTKLIEDLLQSIMSLHLQSTKIGKIGIYRPVFSGKTVKWNRHSYRSTRPISSVILDETEKKKFLADIIEYLNPATRAWYAQRSISYQRGYLLVGPPGTGKTSWISAIAGEFQLDIYTLSLASNWMNGDILSILAGNLPDLCIFLIEDIDTAGLTSTLSNKNRVQESDFLNITDGVGSKPGRVLIMTANKRENISKAILRPGRIDYEMEFDLLHPDTTIKLFLWMFGPEACEIGTPTAKDPSTEWDERIQDLAAEFADKVPDDKFSPAEIQGYLMRHKEDPEKAVQDIDDWVAQTSAQTDPSTCVDTGGMLVKDAFLTQDVSIH